MPAWLLAELLALLTRFLQAEEPAIKAFLLDQLKAMDSRFPDRPLIHGFIAVAEAILAAMPNAAAVA